MSGTAYYFDEHDDPKNVFRTNRPAFTRGLTLRGDEFRDTEYDYNSVAENAKEAKKTSKFTRYLLSLEKRVLIFYTCTAGLHITIKTLIATQATFKSVKGTS